MLNFTRIKPNPTKLSITEKNGKLIETKKPQPQPTEEFLKSTTGMKFKPLKLTRIEPTPLEKGIGQLADVAYGGYKKVISKEPSEIPTLDFFDKVKDMENRPEQLIPFISSGAEALKFRKLLISANNLKNNKASKEDIILLNKYVKENSKDTTFGYKILDVISMMPSFAGELYLTSGVATAGRAITKKGAEKILKNLFTESSKKLLGKKSVQFGIKVGAEIGARTLQTPISGATRIIAGTIEKQLQGTLGEIADESKKEDVWLSATKSFGEQWVETVSEFSGGLLKVLSKPIKNQMLKVALFTAFKKTNPIAKTDDLAKIVGKLGYHGVLGEMFEERIADIGHGTLYELGLGNQKFSLPSAKQLAVELVAFSVPGVAISAINKFNPSLKKINEYLKKQPVGLSLKDVSKEPTKLNLTRIEPEAKPAIKPAEPISKELEPLAKETDPITKAKKFVKEGKSVEEFVKAQPKVYHGTDKVFNLPKTDKDFFITSSRKEAINFGKNIKEFYIDKNTKIKTISFRTNYPSQQMRIQIEQDINIAKKEGIDLLKIKREIPSAGKYSNILKKRKALNKLKNTSIFKEADKKAIIKMKNIEEFLPNNIAKKYKELITEIRPTHYVVLNKNAIKTKSQLTDIYNQATKEVKPVEEKEFNIAKRKEAEIVTKENIEIKKIEKAETGKSITITGYAGIKNGKDSGFRSPEISYAQGYADMKNGKVTTFTNTLKNPFVTENHDTALEYLSKKFPNEVEIINKNYKELIQQHYKKTGKMISTPEMAIESDNFIKTKLKEEGYDSLIYKTLSEYQVFDTKLKTKNIVKKEKPEEETPAELQLMAEQFRIEHLKDLADAIKSGGGLKTPTGLTEEMSEIPIYLRNKKGFTPDEMAQELSQRGFFYEDGNALLEALRKIPGGKAIEAVETKKIQERIKELKSDVVTKTKEFEVISDELKEKIVPFFRPPRMRVSRAFQLLGNKDTTIPLFSEIFNNWVKNGIEVIVEPYGGAYTLGTFSLEQSMKSGLKEFHSNMFDKEKYIIVKKLQNGKLNEVQISANKAVKTFNEKMLKHAKSESAVSKVFENFMSKNPTSYIGSNKWVVYMRKRKIGKEVLIYKDFYEKYRKVFQDTMDEMASVKVVDLNTAMIETLYKRIGVQGSKGQSLLGSVGFQPFEDRIFGKFGMVQGFKDISASFKLADKYNTKIKIYNKDGTEFIKEFESVPEKTGFYFDPPYVTSAKVYEKHGGTGLEKFASGIDFYLSHKKAFDMVKEGSKIVLTNDVNQEYITKIIDKIDDAHIFAYKENNTPTSLIVDTTTEAPIIDFIIEINEGRGAKSFKWANQKYLAQVIRRGGYTSKTIELLKRHNVPADIIKELKVDGKYLQNLVKVKKEITGEVSATISKNALDYIARTSKIKKIDEKWIKKTSFKVIARDAVDIMRGYETGARFFFRIGAGFKNLVFDPIRAGERLAVKRAYSLRNVKLKSVFKLNKKEAKLLWAYTANKQGVQDIETKVFEFKNLPYKVRKAYIDIRRTTNELYPIVKRITIKRGREIGEIKNYSPLYTRDDIKVFDEGGFNFTRKDPFFGSIIERIKNVPSNLYEQDYRKVMDSWIDGVSRYIDVGERTIGVKYLIDSKEFQEIAGKDVSKKISDWYRNIVSPPKVEGADKGFKVVRNLEAVAILAFKYTVPVKQYLNLFDFYTMLPATRIMKSGIKVYGKSPTAKLARYAGSVQERNLGFAIQDLKNTFIVWGRKPAEYTDRLTAKMGRIALVDQMLIRTKQNGIKVDPKMLKNMERRADDIVDAVMGAMSKSEMPRYFRSELGKNINMFYSQLNSKMQYYVTDIFKDKKYTEMSGNKTKLFSKALLAILIAGYIESTINKLYFETDYGDIIKGSLKQIAGNFPIIGGLAFALETGMPYSPMPVLANITKLFMAIAKGQTEKALWTTSGFFGFPTQLKNIITGSQVIKEGGVYNKQGRLLFSVNSFPEKVRTLLKGKWGSKEAQEYFEEKPKSDIEKEREKIREEIKKERAEIRKEIEMEKAEIRNNTIKK